MASRRHPQRRTAGFTLIELVIVVAIVAILTALAYAGYEFAVRKARRGTAQACLTETAQAMERFYTLHLNYAQDDDDNPPPAPSCSQDVDDHYAIRFAEDEPTATTYIIEAVPLGGQRRDTVCGEKMSIDQQGAKEPAGDCWQ